MDRRARWLDRRCARRSRAGRKELAVTDTVDHTSSTSVRRIPATADGPLTGAPVLRVFEQPRWDLPLRTASRAGCGRHLRQLRPAAMARWLCRDQIYRDGPDEGHQQVNTAEGAPE